MQNDTLKYNLTIVTILIFITQLAVDIYIPGLPRIANAFNVPEHKVMWTVSLNLIGLSLSGLVYGPLSDAIGRKKALLLGTTIFCFSSFFCIYSRSIELVAFWILLQGIGAGAAIPVSFASISDVYKGNEQAKIMSRLHMIMAFSPVLGPVIGNRISSYDDRWYLPIAVVPMIAFPTLLLLITIFKETLTVITKKFDFNNLKVGFKNALVNKNFVCYLLIQSLTFLWLWADSVILPFIFKDMNIPSRYYEYYIIACIGTFMIASIINQKLVILHGAEKMLFYGVIFVLFGGILSTLSFTYFAAKLYIVLLLKLIASFGIGFILGNAAALSVATITNYGAAVALLSSAEMLFGSLGVEMAGYFYHGTILPVLLFIIATSLTSLLILKWYSIIRKSSSYTLL
ncbi:MFS transporter [Orientia tsutsugamushi str. Gilliam]|uniref:MFS transporter n=2 Tax=Orientia tsutsugamushi TaxID=784 RepID=A0A2U3QW45_ORITS|nr:multidrug effflux MFS transporter [Orientia tsutsugamushi]SPR05173.1 MFS transporter [Orientia tsutsugamushi str. Gilliam]SPR07198.1 MFS transporter [Orientia tsutsugamushi]